MTRSPRVAIIEDDFILADALAEVLNRLSFKVCCAASDLADAVELVSTELFDLAVVDLNLHGEWAYPVLEVLKARGIPFVIASAYSNAEIQAPYNDELAITKPYSIDSLRVVMDRLVNDTIAMAM